MHTRIYFDFIKSKHPISDVHKARPCRVHRPVRRTRYRRRRSLFNIRTTRLVMFYSAVRDRMSDTRDSALNQKKKKKAVCAMNHCVRKTVRQSGTWRTAIMFLNIYYMFSYVSAAFSKTIKCIRTCCCFRCVTGETFKKYTRLFGYDYFVTSTVFSSLSFFFFFCFWQNRRKVTKKKNKRFQRSWHFLSI